MSRLTSNEVSGLMEAYASVYEGYGKKKGKKKVMHDCATHGEHAEWGVGAMIKEMHTLDEEGNITHYDVEFEHGIERNVPVEQLTILEGEMHEHYVNDEKNAEVLGEQGGSRSSGSSASQRNQSVSLAPIGNAARSAASAVGGAVQKVGSSISQSLSAANRVPTSSGHRNVS